MIYLHFVNVCGKRKCTEYLGRYMQHFYLIEAAYLAASQAEDEGFNETSAALIEFALNLYQSTQVTITGGLAAKASTTPQHCFRISNKKITFC